jgi:hypothetical protein
MVRHNLFSSGFDVFHGKKKEHHLSAGASVAFTTSLDADATWRYFRYHQRYDRCFSSRSQSYALEPGYRTETRCTTDLDGQYHLGGLPIGTYTARLEKEGFRTEVREGIVLVAAAAITINASLR